MGSLPPIALEPGYRLDRYELLCKIGQGGMASVWLARTQGKHGFERLVAIKTVLPEHATDTGFRTMLVDEARIAAAIDHPNVARIIDVGEERDTPFMVLEYVAGDSLIRLHRKLKEAGRRIPLPIVLRVLADACAGLHAAHELRGADGALLGIVHRDVSPQNILVNDLGIVKLIDFGVAKATGRLAAETATGIIKGKVPYMAPEQALGVPVDRRADIWSMGSVAFLLMAGACPFDAPNDAARVIRAVTGEPPDPLPPSVPSAVAQVVLKALSREAGARFATAAELREALEGAARRSSLTATSEEVAKYFAENLADAATSRKKMLDRALGAAAERERAREALTFDGSSATGSGPRLPGAPGSEPRVFSDLEETSAGTIGQPLELRAVDKKSSPTRLTVAVVGAVALLVAGAFAVGSLTSGGGQSVTAAGATSTETAPAVPAESVPAPAPSTPTSAESAEPAPLAAPSATSAPSAPPAASSATTSSASPSKTVRPPPKKPRVVPGAATTRPPPKPKPKPPTDETIF